MVFVNNSFFYLSNVFIDYVVDEERNYISAFVEQQIKGVVLYKSFDALCETPYFIVYPAMLVAERNYLWNQFINGVRPLFQ